MVLLYVYKRSIKCSSKVVFDYHAMMVSKAVSELDNIFTVLNGNWVYLA